MVDKFNEFKNALMASGIELNNKIMEVRPLYDFKYHHGVSTPTVSFPTRKIIYARGEFDSEFDPSKPGRTLEKTIRAKFIGESDNWQKNWEAVIEHAKTLRKNRTLGIGLLRSLFPDTSQNWF